MKKLILTIIYPLWFFFAKTLVGNVVWGYVIMSLPALALILINPEILMQDTSSEKDDLAHGLGFFSLMLSPFTLSLSMKINDYLIDSYEKSNYRV